MCLVTQCVRTGSGSTPADGRNLLFIRLEKNSKQNLKEIGQMDEGRADWISRSRKFCADPSFKRMLAMSRGGAKSFGAARGRGEKEDTAHPEFRDLHFSIRVSEGA